MSETFDPYHKWLGIPPADQPASYYRLLGIAEFESDADVIQFAADRQMAHVRSFQTGRHAAESQRLLNELSTARVVLLKPERKTAYDAELRASRAPTAPPVAPSQFAPPMPAPMPYVAAPHPMAPQQYAQQALAPQQFAPQPLPPRTFAPAAPQPVMLRPVAVQPVAPQPVVQQSVEPEPYSPRPQVGDSPLVQVAGGAIRTNAVPIRRRPSSNSQSQVYIAMGVAVIVLVGLIAILARGGKEKPVANSSPGQDPSSQVSSSSEPSAKIESSSTALPEAADTTHTTLDTSASSTPETVVSSPATSSSGPETTGAATTTPDSSQVTPEVKITIDSDSSSPTMKTAGTAISPQQPAARTSTSNAGPKPLTPAVNLLTIIQLARDTQRTARLRWQGPTLVGYPRDEYCTQIPYHPAQPAYRIDMLAQCIEGGGPINVGLCVNGRQFLVGLDWAGSTFVGRHPTSHHHNDSNWRIPIWDVNTPVPISILVDQTKLSVIAGGKTIIDRYDHTELLRYDGWNGKDTQALAIGWNMGSFGIYSAYLRPLPDGVPSPRAISPPLVFDLQAEGGVPIDAPPRDQPAPPDAELTTAAVMKVRETFRSEYLQLTSPSHKAALAGQLAAQALHGEVDELTEYALWNEVVRLGSEAGDWRYPNAAIRAMAAKWQVDVWKLTADAMSESAKQIKDKDVNKLFADFLLQLLTNLERNAQHDYTVRIAILAQSAATESKDVDLKKRVTVRANEVRRVATEFQAVDRNAEILKTMPDDPAANLGQGRHLCRLNRWDEGLPMLVKSKEQPLAALAERDLAAPQDSTDQLALADAMWNAATSDKIGVKDVLRTRAGHWYRQALPQLSNLTKFKAEKRLEELNSGAN